MRADAATSELVELEAPVYENSFGCDAFSRSQCGVPGRPSAVDFLHSTRAGIGQRPTQGVELEAGRPEAQPAILSQIPVEKLLGSRPPDGERSARQGDPRPA